MTDRERGEEGVMLTDRQTELLSNRYRKIYGRTEAVKQMVEREREEERDRLRQTKRCLKREGESENGGNRQTDK